MELKSTFEWNVSKDVFVLFWTTLRLPFKKAKIKYFWILDHNHNVFLSLDPPPFPFLRLWHFCMFLLFQEKQFMKRKWWILPEHIWRVLLTNTQPPRSILLWVMRSSGPNYSFRTEQRYTKQLHNFKIVQLNTCIASILNSLTTVQLYKTSNYAYKYNK